MFSFATGLSVFDADGRLGELVNQAKVNYNQGPEQLTRLQKANWRITLTENLSDLDGLQREQIGASIFAGWAITRALEGYCALNRLWAMKQEKLVSEVSSKDEELGRFINGYEKTRV